MKEVGIVMCDYCGGVIEGIGVGSEEDGGVGDFE